ncbi:MAG: TetR/AcrR family transcriptional regulator [Chitinophagaceae bacterium]|nr:TetR/AcrR family transcriptional regulator [Chitinophagaceae bacterium]
MSIKDSVTENLIKETAKKVFFVEGRFNATTQEIADAAGVNRTLVNYYFRSRDLLFEKVLVEGQQEFRASLEETINPAFTFKEKIGHFIDVWMAHSLKYPYLDAYLASQANSGNYLDKMHKSKSQEEEKKKAAFLKEIKLEMEKGTIPEMDPMQYMINLISMISYPLSMRPVLEKAFNLNKKNYAAILDGRKNAILKSLFKD